MPAVISDPASPVRICKLHIAEPYRRTLRSTLENPQRIHIAWHRHARGIYELLTATGTYNELAA